MNQPKRIDELPVLRELQSPAWGNDFPWVTDDLFQREYQGLVGTPWGDVVAYRSEDVNALMKHRSVTHQTLESMTADYCPVGAPKDRGVSGFIALNSFAFRPPEHRPLKELTAAPLAPASLVDFRGIVRDLAVEAIQKASQLPVIDCVSDLTKPLVGDVWAQLVGVTAEEAARLFELQNDDLDLLNNQLTADQVKAGNADADEYMAILTEALRRSHRSGDFPLLNSLVDAHGAMGEVGRPEDPLKTFASILSDGFVALPGMLSTTIWAVTEYGLAYPNPEDVDSWAASVFSEVSRLHPAVVATFRQASDDFDYEGVHIPKDTNIWMLWLFANRDPAVFPDPLAFRPERPGRRKQVTFGGGAYGCTGQNVARLVCEEILKALALTGVSLRLEDPASWSKRPMNHEFQSLRISLSPQTSAASLVARD